MTQTARDHPCAATRPPDFESERSCRFPVLPEQRWMSLHPSSARRCDFPEPCTHSLPTRSHRHQSRAETPNEHTPRSSCRCHSGVWRDRRWPHTEMPPREPCHQQPPCRSRIFAICQKASGVIQMRRQSPGQDLPPRRQAGCER